MQYSTSAAAVALLSTFANARPTPYEATAGDIANALFTPGYQIIAESNGAVFPEHINVTFSKPNPGAVSTVHSDDWTETVQALIDEGIQYILNKQKNLTIDQLPLYTIQASTNATDNSTTTGQADFTGMEIDFAVKNGSRIIEVDNLGGDDDSSSSWEGPFDAGDTIDSTTGRSWSYKDKDTWYAGMAQAKSVLDKKNLSGPWDYLTISLPTYTPANNFTQLNTNNSLYYEVSSAKNLSVSYIFSQDGRVFKRSL